MPPAPGARSIASGGRVLILTLTLITLTSSLLATDPGPGSIAPPTLIMVNDLDYDNGESLTISWVPSLDDVPGQSEVVAYRILRSSGGGQEATIGTVLAGESTFVDQSVNRDSAYVYRVATIAANGGEGYSLPTDAVVPNREWLNWDLVWLFLACLVLGGSVVFFIETARRGKKLFVRKIAGLEAIDEAIGRATEMGRPILYIPGIQDMDEVETLASLTILGKVSRQIADYDTQLFMPVARSLVMTAGRETIKTSYLEAGRADAFNEDMVRYITDEQFGYVAAVDGYMVRERPATIFLLGAFFGESLVLAEMGNSVGAIQIAGTARPPQIPFFVAACDYTLIGEELFAASAYLSGEPRQLGSLKGQDVGKGIAMAVILIGVAAATIAELTGSGFFAGVVSTLQNVFTTR